MNKLQIERARIQAIIDAKVDAASESAAIEVLNNPIIQAGMVRTAKVERTLAKLKDIETKCSGIVAAMPMYSTKTRENRKWSPSSQFNLSTEVSNLVRILTGIQYSAAEHKQQMLAITGLSEALLDNTLASLGSLPYYNRNYGVLVEGQPATSDLAVNLQLCANALDTVIDTGFINETFMTRRTAAARIKAETQAAEVIKATAASDDKIIM